MLQQQPAPGAQGSQPWHIPGGRSSPSPCAPANPSGVHTLLVDGYILTFGVPGELTVPSTLEKQKFLQESSVAPKPKSEGFPSNLQARAQPCRTVLRVPHSWSAPGPWGL